MLKCAKKLLTVCVIPICLLLIIVIYNTSKLEKPDFRNKLSPTISRLDKFPKAVENFSKSLKINTVSDPNSEYYDHNNFKKFITFLSDTYPEFSKKFEKKIINDSVLYKWSGKNALLPAVVIMAHYDTVPVEQADLSKWKTNPFSGEVFDNKVWGRGAIDNKGNLIAALEAVQFLLKNNYQPERDIYIAIGADEEVYGTGGNKLLADYLYNNNVKIGAVYDEGVPIIKDFASFVSKPIASISVAEKGYASFLLTATGSSGHSSTGSKNNAIVRLSKLLKNIDDYEQEIYWPETLTSFIEGLAPYSETPYKMLFANLWISKPFVKYALQQQQSTQPLVKTVSAITKFNAGIKDNVIPTHAEAIVNYRLIHGETVSDIKSKLEGLAKQLGIKVEHYGKSHSDPVPPASTRSDFYQALQKAINNSYPEAIVVPGTMIAMTDSRYYAKLTPNIYRFTPFVLTPKTAQSIHGINEALDIDDYLRGIDVYAELIKGVS